MIEFSTIEYVILWLFFIYMIINVVIYLVLNLIAFYSLSRYIDVSQGTDNEALITGFEPPISIIIPAHNEEQTIISSIRSLMQLNYPSFELIVVNDGSKDNTLAVLEKHFDLVPFPEAYKAELPSKPVNQVYVSHDKPNLRVIDKVNGGKSDALNSGINISRCPIFCCVDADSILEPYSLVRAVQPFIEQPDTIACGGTVRIANGCEVKYGHIVKKGIPRNLLALLQLIEYLRSFLFARIGWSRLNALLIISGAFGLFKRQAVIDAGGYDSATVGEDMELIVRLHRLNIKNQQPYKISFIPDPVCWTEAPESLRIFSSQRTRWHRGLSESLWLNRELLFAKNSGNTGFLAFPFFIVFEWFSPFVEIAGYLFTILLLLTGKVNLPIAAIFFLFAAMLSVMLSTIALLLDEITFKGISRLRYIPVLFLASILECLGYRQINAFFRIKGALKWILGSKHEWGKMTRKGTWQQHQE